LHKKEYPMTRKAVVTLTTLCILLVVVAFVYAGVHFGLSSSVSFGSLKATVNIFGVGQSADVTVTLHATGNDLTAYCQNKGGNRAPGQNPVDVNVSTSQTVTADSNGNATANFEVSLVSTTSSKAAGCPNDGWKVTDLYGTLHVTFFVVDNVHGDSDTMSVTCTVDEQHRSVTCF
jgi:hypothetical protein